MPCALMGGEGVGEARGAYASLVRHAGGRALGRGSGTREVWDGVVGGGLLWAPGWRVLKPERGRGVWLFVTSSLRCPRHDGGAQWELKHGLQLHAHATRFLYGGTSRG